jgi:hypothetical protein
VRLFVWGVCFGALGLLLPLIKKKWTCFFNSAYDECKSTLHDLIDFYPAGFIIQPVSRSGPLLRSCVRVSTALHGSIAIPMVPGWLAGMLLINHSLATFFCVVG